MDMKISRTKFVIMFLIAAFAFQFITNSLSLSEIRMFPAHGESFLGTGSQTGWRSLVSNILLPVKVVLIGPLLPYINLLRQEPDTPPPFFLIGFAFYWTILALTIYYIFGRINRSKNSHSL